MQKVGDTVKLYCSAGGSPLPKITWLKDARRIHSPIVHGAKDLTEGELVINNFKPTDAGIYTCLFYNDKNATAETKTSLSLLFLMVEQRINSEA